MDAFIDRTNGLSTITNLVVNDSFNVQSVRAKTITTTGDVNVAKNCTITENLNVGKNLNVNDDVNFAKNCTITSNLTVNGTLNATLFSDKIKLGTNAGKNNQVTGGIAIGQNASQNNDPVIAPLGGIIYAVNVSRTPIIDRFGNPTGQDTIVVSYSGSSDPNLFTVGQLILVELYGNFIFYNGNFRVTEHVVPTITFITVSTGENYNSLSVIAGSYIQRYSETVSSSTIAMGRFAGELNQRTGAIAIGYEAGQQNQGTNSIAIGNLAGKIAQADQSICINASGNNLNASKPNSCYIRPIRNVSDNVDYGSIGGYVLGQTSLFECLNLSFSGLYRFQYTTSLSANQQLSLRIQFSPNSGCFVANIKQWSLRNNPSNPGDVCFREVSLTSNRNPGYVGGVATQVYGQTVFNHGGNCRIDSVSNGDIVYAGANNSKVSLKLPFTALIAGDFTTFFIVSMSSLNGEYPYEIVREGIGGFTQLLGF